MARSDSRATLPMMIAEQSRRQGDQPLMTMYDHLTGARTELSYATADNWASKTANLLVEEFDLSAGATVALDLTGHWTTVALALACWKVGAAVRCDDVPADAAVVCCHESRIDAHPRGGLVVAGDGLRAEPVGAPITRDGVLLLGEDVHAFADDYDDPDVTAAEPAIVSRTHTRSQADVLARATDWRERLGDDAPRVAVATGIDHAGVLELLAGVMLAGGSVVAERPAPTTAPWQRWTPERVTAVVGDPDVARGAPDAVTMLDLDGGTHPRQG